MWITQSGLERKTIVNYFLFMIKYGSLGFVLKKDMEFKSSPEKFIEIDNS